MRLDKFLKECGYGTRKECRYLARSGRVSINNVVVKEESTKVDIHHDVVTVDGQKAEYHTNLFFMLNKPKGTITATYDNKKRTVLDLIKEHRHRDLFPYGRLDIDTEGLLIIGDDGQLAHRLLSPKHHVEKEYELTTNAPISSDLILKFSSGIVLEDGTKCLPASLQIISDNQARITIVEGKFHQVKRMFQMCGLEVTFLKRIRFHTIVLDPQLLPGQYRLLNYEEIARLRNLDSV